MCTYALRPRTAPAQHPLKADEMRSFVKGLTRVEAQDDQVVLVVIKMMKWVDTQDAYYLGTQMITTMRNECSHCLFYILKLMSF